MGRWAWALVWLVGCAPAERARLTVRSGGEPLSRAFADEARRAERPLRDCFDDAAERRDLDGALELQLKLVARAGETSLLRAIPRDRATVVDGALEGCLRDVTSAWRAAADGMADLFVRAEPKPRPPQAMATERRFRPEE